MSHPAPAAVRLKRDCRRPLIRGKAGPQDGKEEGTALRFTKMQGLGNDYVYLDCTREMPKDLPGLARRLSDRHFGVGSDGLICICPSKTADFRMAMFNADGSEGEMCGNGIRCVGKFVYDKGLTSKTSLTIETLAGPKALELRTENGAVVAVTVDMGAPILEPERIPVEASGSDFIARRMMAGGREWEVTCVSMGNPHAVVFVPEVDSLPLAQLGPAFEHHPSFPHRINTEFVQVENQSTLRMRVWERGSGETLACGTGACASLVAAVLNAYTAPVATVKLLGGNLTIRWDREADGHVYMTGPAVTVFEGDWPY